MLWSGSLGFTGVQQKEAAETGAQSCLLADELIKTCRYGVARPLALQAGSAGQQQQINP